MSPFRASAASVVVHPILASSLIALLGAVGCTKLTKSVETNRRTVSTTTTPETSPLPTPPPPPDPGATPAPSTSPPTTPLPEPVGVYELTEVHCVGRNQEAAKTKLRFVNQAGGAFVESRDGDGPEGCLTRQPAALTMTASTMELKLGATACEGACTGTCPESIIAPKGTTTTGGYTPVSGGFSLALPGVKLAAHCGGEVPESFAFTRIGDGECGKTWNGFGSSRTALATDQLNVLDGQLTWSTEKLTHGEIHSLAAEGLSGDFTIVAEIAGFEPGGVGAFFRLQAEDQGDPTRRLFAQFGTYAETDPNPAQLLAAVVPGGTFDEAQHAKIATRSDHEGSLTLSRKGQTLTARAEAGSKSAERVLELTNPPNGTGTIGSGPFRVLLELGHGHPSVDLALPTAVALASVTVKDSSGATVPPSDAFDCDSIAP